MPLLAVFVLAMKVFSAAWVPAPHMFARHASMTAALKPACLAGMDTTVKAPSK